MSKFERVAKLLKEKVEIGDPISNEELDDCIEVLQSILDFAGGYKDKILLTWAAMSLAPLQQVKRYRVEHPKSWFEKSSGKTYWEKDGKAGLEGWEPYTD